MAEEHPAPKIELDDLMLAMDVVDTLRHRRSLAERELSADTYDQALIEKVRKIYADQGLAVSEEVIAAGVAAMREDRFTYKPPGGGFQVMLARLYVSRGRWAKWGGAALALVLGLWLVFQFVFVMPANRERARLAGQLDAAWQNFEAVGHDPALVKIGSRLNQQARQDLKAGKSEAAAAVVAQLETLAVLPQQLEAWYAGAVGEAREKAAAIKAENLYRDAGAALRGGDVTAAGKHARNLQTLLEGLKQEYTLQIVSRPDTRSGVWRHPDDNSSARNYYIIVEAVTSDGHKLALPITSEEDGRTRETDIWGVRVDAGVFDQIRRDKMDNGILDRNRFGVKKRGYLTPDYLYPTTGKAITQW